MIDKGLCGHQQWCQLVDRDVHCALEILYLLTYLLIGAVVIFK